MRSFGTRADEPDGLGFGSAVVLGADAGQVSTNNGDLQSQWIQTCNGAGYAVANNYFQGYSYDGLNRLTAFKDENGADERDFNYDNFGNLWVTRNTGSFPPLSASTPQSNIYSANRRTDTTYDAAGNETSVAGVCAAGCLQYDVESRQTGYTPTGTSYSYDGDGRRVISTANGVNTVFVYDAMGNLAAKYTSGVGGAVPCTTCYLSWDHLGSTRMVTDQVGNLVARHDFLAFGEEIRNGYAGRPSNGVWGGLDSVNQKFTGKERDSESGLDYFRGRYFSGAQGRFTSVDPAFESAILELPQTWNRYSYVYNRPTFGTDPDGRCPICVGAIVGGVVEGGWNLGSQLYQNGGNLGAVAWGEVGANALGGAAAGALAVATGGTSLVSNALVGDIVAGVGSTVAGGVVTRTANGESAGEVFSPGEISTDAVAGFVGGAGGYVAADFIHIPEEPTLRRSRNNNVGRRARAKYNAAGANRNSAMRLQAGVGVVAGSFPTHGTTGFLNNFWNIFDWFSSPPIPPPLPPPPSPPPINGTTSTFTPCQAGDTTPGCN